MAGFKNTDMYVWSGGGATYAHQFAMKFNLPHAKCRGKLDSNFKPDIVIDDIQDCNLGNLNLIVREK